jgi:preprotein translocase subunit SecY
MSYVQMLLTMLTLSAGTILLMWIGELISERKIGNGVSIIIFTGIVASLPGFIQRFLATYESSQLLTVLTFIAIVLATIVVVVLINEGTRNVPISYSRHVRAGGGSGGVSTHLPMRINSAGMIPIIFAISLVLFPTLIAQFTVQAKSAWLVTASRWVIATYFILVFGFTYFYTSVVFHPEKVAENLQKQGAFVPGIRPGEATRHYLGFVSSRIVFTGALFLATIAVVPLIVQEALGTANLIIGASSVLIVVSVVIDMVKQIESHLTMRDYEM